jgi:N-acetylglucosaminyl-diphospho-decaprenol L-rhamnosyltransferase
MTLRAHHDDVRGTDAQIAIVVLAYGAGDKLAGLLEHLSVEPQTACNLIVVHNPSRSHQRLAMAPKDDLQVIELDTNSGYVGGMNAGIDRAMQGDAEFVLLLTHDVRITAQAVLGLRDVMRDHPELGVVGPVLGTPEGMLYSAGFVESKRVQMRLRPPSADMPKPTWPCAAIDGSVMMWRAGALAEVHGFDERFFMYFDDIDICTRAARRGWTIAVATDVRAVSAPGGSSRRAAHAYLRARNSLAHARGFGRVGVVAGLAGCATGLWRATPKPGGKRFRNREAQRASAAYWRGTLLGVADYFRGRWGAPPSSMLRDSDIAGT